jgi:hypothetical protein
VFVAVEVDVALGRIVAVSVGALVGSVVAVGGVVGAAEQAVRTTRAAIMRL